MEPIKFLDSNSHFEVRHSTENFTILQQPDVNESITSLYTLSCIQLWKNHLLDIYTSCGEWKNV